LTTYLVAYGSAEWSQISVLTVLNGNTGTSGRLPISIPGIAPRGTGILKEARK
jgi:hypothetical protein